jgi:ABC-type sugar transport system ATPase subunit
VRDVSFAVARGEVFGFLGPNGAGKTTTVRILGTLIAPTSGSASVAGIPVGPATEAEIRQHISITTEAPGLYNRLTVAENLEFFARLYGLSGPPPPAPSADSPQSAEPLNQGLVPHGARLARGCSLMRSPWGSRRRRAPSSTMSIPARCRSRAIWSASRVARKLTS